MRRTEQALEAELQKLKDMEARNSYEAAAELSCAVAALEWALGRKKRPLSQTYGTD
jgi:uncharacterized membrane protein